MSKLDVIKQRLKKNGKCCPGGYEPELSYLISEVERLRGVLGFYAKCECGNQCDFDGGLKARKALEEKSS